MPSLVEMVVVTEFIDSGQEGKRGKITQKRIYKRKTKLVVVRFVVIIYMSQYLI